MYDNQSTKEPLIVISDIGVPPLEEPLEKVVVIFIIYDVDFLQCLHSKHDSKVQYLHQLLHCDLLPV